jgi:uncharacterized protein (DUF58 family)
MNVRRASDLRITRRGRVAVLLIVLSVVLGWQFGSRALNAVAAPTLAALLVGAVYVRRSGEPTVELSEMEAGFPGDARTLTATLSGSGIATVEVRMPYGTSGEQIDATVTLPHTFELATTLEQRGVYRIGPPVVRQQGPLGLVERRVETEETATLAVYPRPYSLDRDGVVTRFFADELETERQEFDRLREYVPEDPLRHIHWKSSAKHDEFMVMEFAPTERTETVTIAASAVPGSADEMARTAATIAEAVLDAGFDVELVVPDGVLPPGQGETHRRHLLGLLARAEAGPVPDPVAAEADVAIESGTEGTDIRIGTRRHTLSDLVAGDGERPAPTRDRSRVEVTA